MSSLDEGFVERSVQLAASCSAVRRPRASAHAQILARVGVRARRCAGSIAMRHDASRACRARRLRCPCRLRSRRRTRSWPNHDRPAASSTVRFRCRRRLRYRCGSPGVPARRCLRRHQVVAEHGLHVLERLFLREAEADAAFFTGFLFDELALAAAAGVDLRSSRPRADPAARRVAASRLVHRR